MKEFVLGVMICLSICFLQERRARKKMMELRERCANKVKNLRRNIDFLTEMSFVR
jgi:hypothetical protein